MVKYELEKTGYAPERLTAAEKKQIVSVLASNGVFCLKAAVKAVAAGLHCSQASIYRYLSEIKKQNSMASPKLSLCEARDI